MSLTLPAPKVIVEQQSITTATIVRMVDLPVQRIVRVFIEELQSPLVLWEGDAYDAIGNWTQEQADARIIALLS